MKKSYSNNYSRLIIFLSLFVSLLGVLAIYNASIVESFNTFGDKYHFAKAQLSWVFIGLIVFFIVSKIQPEYYKKIAFPLFVGTMILMVLVIIPGIGTKLQGARRWLSIGPAIGQPSELLKISLVIYLAFWLETKRTIKNFFILSGSCLGLIMLQPDLGTAMVVAVICFGLYYISGSSSKELLISTGIGLSVLLVLIVSSPYRLDRMKTFLDPTSDKQGRSYHINQVLLGLGSGGFWGVGIGRSKQKYSYLPEATTDSIFTVIGEETGFVGSVLLIVLLLFLVQISFAVASDAGDRYRQLLASGVALLLAAQSFINLSSMVALIPLTGIPLPLISYGGSSTLITFVALGILTSIANHK